MGLSGISNYHWICVPDFPQLCRDLSFAHGKPRVMPGWGRASLSLSRKNFRDNFLSKVYFETCPLPNCVLWFDVNPISLLKLRMWNRVKCLVEDSGSPGASLILNFHTNEFILLNSVIWHEISSSVSVVSLFCVQHFGQFWNSWWNFTGMWCWMSLGSLWFSQTWFKIHFREPGVHLPTFTEPSFTAGGSGRWTLSKGTVSHGFEKFWL